MKKKLALILALAMCFGILAACAPDAPAPAPEAPAPEAAPAPDAAAFTPAAQIEPPPGKTMRVLPVDQVSDTPLRIASLMMHTNPFGAAVAVGSQFAGEILADRNVTVDSIHMEGFDVHDWTVTIDSLIAAGYDAIAFFGISEALQPVTDRGVDAGILMYAFNTEPGNYSQRHAWFGQSGFDGGVAAGEHLMELMGGEGEFIIVTGDFAVLGHEERRLGARSVLDENPNMVLMGEFQNNDRAEEAFSIVTDAILANPNLRGVYVTAGGPAGAARAIEDLNMQDQISLVIHDVLDASAPYIANGTVSVAIDQDPFNQGFMPVVAAFNHLVAGVVPDNQNFFEAVIATPQNVRQLFPEFFE